MRRSGLRVIRASAEAIEIDGRAAREGPLLVAAALAAIGLTPLLAPGPITVLRMTTFLALAALAAAIALGAIGRRRRVRIFPERAELVADGRKLPLGSARALVLAAAGAEADDQPRLTYRVDLELAEGRAITLLEGRDPAEVLRDLAELLPLVQLPVRRGWQLPSASTPWRPGGSAALATQADLDFVAAPLPSQRRAAVAVLGGALFTTVAMGVMFAARSRRGAETALTSWLLAGATITALYAIGIYVATERVRVRRHADKLTIEHSVFGRVRRAEQLAAADVSGAYAIGPHPDELRHVLLETRRGPIAIACAGPAAAELADALSNPDRPSR